eukprot:170955-Rhodomonas_salina.1
MSGAEATCYYGGAVLDGPVVAFTCSYIIIVNWTLLQVARAVGHDGTALGDGGGGGDGDGGGDDHGGDDGDADDTTDSNHEGATHNKTRRMIAENNA